MTSYIIRRRLKGSRYIQKSKRSWLKKLPLYCARYRGKLKTGGP